MIFRMIKPLLLFIFLTSVLCDPTQNELKAIKGVPTSRFVLYQPSGANRDNFQCLDGSRTILYSQLNDDYCDCKDGSDEPGTSACNNMQFYCSNTGHKGNFIPSSRVNDKLCDCCDGSDEYSSGVSCPNICDELGRAAKIEREKVANVARKGFAKRQELSKEAKTMQGDKLKGVEPLKAEKEAILPELEKLEAAKRSAEDVERKLRDEHQKKWQDMLNEKKKVKAAEWFAEIDVNQDGKITIDEVKLLPYLDEDRNNEITDDEAKKHLSVDEADVQHFTDNMFETLKSLKKLYENDLKLKAQMEKEKANAEKEDDTLLAEEDRIEEEEEELDGNIEQDEDRMPDYPPEVQQASDAAQEARKQYDEVNNKVIDIDSKIREAEDFSLFDFGPDMAWATVKGKCFERNVQQYTYEFCPFGQNHQKEGGYGGTSLGVFKNWGGQDGKDYSKQKYEDGQQCWNGPKRSTDVVIECGEEHELVEVTEPAKCEYHFVFRTPLACNDPDSEPIHEEL